MIACVPPHGESPASRSMSPCNTQKRLTIRNIWLFGARNEEMEYEIRQGKKVVGEWETEASSWSGTTEQMIRAGAGLSFPRHCFELCTSISPCFIIEYPPGWLISPSITALDSS